MLKQPLPGALRRRASAALLIVVIGSAGYACWAAQTVVGTGRLHLAATTRAPGTPVALHMKWTISDADVAPAKRSDVTSSKTVLVFNVVATAGSPVELFNPEMTFAASCTPTLLGGASKDRDNILVKCTLSSHGRVLGTPALLIADGTTAALEVGDAARPHLSRLEINASTRPANIAAVSEDAAGGVEDAEDVGDADDAPDAPDVPDAPDAADSAEPPAPAAPPPTAPAPPAPAVAPMAAMKPI